MMNWMMRKSCCCGGGRRQQQEMRERLIVPATGGQTPSCVPRGCVAVLVGEEDDEVAPERVVVDLRALGQPCVRALLDMAEREFGYAQKGVLRIPCAADEFRRAVEADTAATAYRCRR